MLRRLVLLLLAVVVPLGIVVLAGWPIVSRNNWAKQRLHEALTIQLAQTLDAEVRVEDVKGNLATGFVVTDIAISEGQRLADGIALAADELHVKCDLWPAIRRETPPIETIEEVRIVGLWANLARGPDGKLNIDRFLPKRPPPKEPPKARFKGQIVVEDAELLYTDTAAEPAVLYGLDLHLAALDAIADFAKADVIEYAARADAVRAPFSHVEAAGSYATATKALYANGTVSGAQLPPLYGRFVNDPAIRLHSGTATVTGNVCVVPGELVDYAVSGHASRVVANVDVLDGERISASSTFTATPAGLVIDRADVTGLGAQITGSGTVFDLAQPTVDLEVQVRHADLERWAKLAPEGALDALPEVRGADDVTLAGRVTGTLTDPHIDLGAQFPHPVEVHYVSEPVGPAEVEGREPPVVNATASGLTVAVSVPDVTTQDVAISASAKELRLSDLGVFLPVQEYVSKVQPAPLLDVQAEIAYSRAAAATAGRLTIDEVATDQGPLRGVDLRYALVGKAVRADVSIASALGAEVSAQGSVDFSGDELAAYADFDADNVQLATVAAIADRADLDVEGIVGASGVFVLQGQEFEVAADAFGRDLRMDAIEVDRLAAQARATPGRVEVKYLTAQSPLGSVWARGIVPFEGPLEAEFAVADTPLSQVQTIAETYADRQDSPAGPQENRESKPIELRGSAFLHGFAEGEVRRPHIIADAAVFDGGTTQYTAPIVTASIDAAPEEVRLSDVVVRRGTGVASADVTLSDIQWPPGSFFWEEKAGTDSSHAVEPGPVDGKLRGTARVAGLDLAQLGEFITLPSQVRVAGVVASDLLQLSGTLGAPELSGGIAIAHAKAVYEPQQIAVGPFDLDLRFDADRDRVRLPEAVASGSAGTLRVLSGELSGWNAEDGASVVADFEASDLPVSAYTPAEGPAALLEGTVNTVSGHVAGPLAAPWPTVAATVAADEVRFARRTVRDVSGRLTYEYETLGAYDLSCGLAEGEVAVRAATYHPGEQKLFVHGGAEGLSAPQALFLVGDVASGGQTDTDSVALRDKLYGLGHRLRGTTVSLDEVMVGGTLQGLEGKVAGLRAEGPRFDDKSLPSLEAGFRFVGLAPAAVADRQDDSRYPPAIAHLRVDDLRVVASEAGTGSIVVRGSEESAGATVHLDGPINLVADAYSLPVREVNQWVADLPDVGGEMSFTVEATGTAEAPEITATATVERPTIAGVTFDVLDILPLRVEESAIYLTGSLLKRGEHELRAWGRLPFDRDTLTLQRNEDVAFEAEARDLPISVVLELADQFGAGARTPADSPSFLSRCEAAGVVTATLGVSGELAQPKVDGHVYLEDTGSLRFPAGGRSIELANLGFDAYLSRSDAGVGATVDIGTATAKWGDTTFWVVGSLDISHLDPNELLENRINELTVTAEATRQRLAGTRLGSPTLEIVGQTDDDGWHVFRVEEGSAQLGRGSAELSGVILLDTLDASKLGHVPCDLRLVLDRAEIEHEPIVKRAQLDGVIVARKLASRTGRALPEWFQQRRVDGDSLDPQAPIRIASVPASNPAGHGRVEITRARIGMPGPRSKEEPPPGTAEPPGQDGEEQWTALPGTMPGPQIDVALGIGHHVRLDWPLIKGEFVPDTAAVVFTGTPQDPTFHARASLREGSFRVVRGNLDVPEARVRLDIATAPLVGEAGVRPRELVMDSEVYVRAEGTISGTTFTGEHIAPTKVNVEVTGDLTEYEVKTSSDPPRPPGELIPLLATAPLRPGHGVGTERELTADEMVAQALATQAIRGVLEPLEEELAEALGLEEFELVVGLNQPVQVRVGKYLIDDLLISYTRSAGGPEEQFDLRLSYNLRDKYTVSWHTDERERQQIAVEYRWQF